MQACNHQAVAPRFPCNLSMSNSETFAVDAVARVRAVPGAFARFRVRRAEFDLSFHYNSGPSRTLFVLYEAIRACCDRGRFGVFSNRAINSRRTKDVPARQLHGQRQLCRGEAWRAWLWCTWCFLRVYVVMVAEERREVWGGQHMLLDEICWPSYRRS